MVKATILPFNYNIVALLCKQKNVKNMGKYRNFRPSISLLWHLSQTFLYLSHHLLIFC